MSDKYLTAEQVIEIIKELAKSQGRYQRIYETLLELERTEPESYESIKTGFELQKFSDTLDVVMFFEA